MFIVKAKSVGDSYGPDIPGGDNLRWIEGQTRLIHEGVISYYRSNPTAWEIVDNDESLVRSATNPVTGGIGYPEVQRGITTVLLGDSLMLNLISPSNPAAFEYNDATGVATVTRTSHGFYTGQPVQIAVKGRPEWCHFDLRITRIDANNYTIQLPPGLGSAPATLAEIWIGYAQYLRSDYPFAWLRARRPKLLRICGVTSERATEIRARLPQALAMEPTVIELRAGTNDRGVTPVESVIADIDLMVREISSRGIVCILHTVPAVGAPTAAIATWIVTLNRLILALAGKYPNLRICDDYAAVVDPASALGASLSGALGSDNLHFAGKAGRLIAARLQACYDSIYQTVSHHPTSVIQAYDPTNNPSGWDAFGNGLLATTTGGTAGTATTGTVAAGLIVKGVASTCPVVASVVDADVGKAQRAVGVPTANNDQILVQLASVHARCASGERRRFQCHVKTSGIPANGAVKNVSMLVQITLDGVTYSQIRAHYTPQASAGMYLQHDIDADFETEPFEIPAGSVTSVQPQVQVDFSGGGSAVTLDVSQIAVPLEI